MAAAHPHGPAGAPGRSGRRRSPSARRLGLLAAVLVVVVAFAARSGGADQHGVAVVRFTIASRLLHRVLPATAVIPPGAPARSRPLVVFLHGKGPDGQDANLSEELFAALARLGPRAPVIVFPNGGEDSYWHDRAGGGWGSYVVREVIPDAIRRFAVDPRRLAIGGISMGGFGALDLARLNPGRFCAVGAHSPALWTQGGDSAPGAFDDAADFARHDVLAAVARANPYRGLPVWVDVGTADPFRSADTRLAAGLHGHGAAVAFHVWPGGHDGGYWRAHVGRYLGFYAAALARCGPRPAGR